MTDSRRIAKNTLFLYFRMALSTGVSLVTAGVTLRVLGAVDYGLNAVLGGVIAMFSFMNGALSASVSRNITFELGKGDDRRLNQVFNVSLVSFAVLSFVILLLCETVGLWFFRTKMVIPHERMDAAFWVLQISFLTCPLSLTQIPYGAVLIAHEDMRMYAYTSVADAFARLGIVYLLLISPFDKLITFSFLGMIWGLILLCFFRVYCISKYKETRLRFCREKLVYRHVLSYAGSDLIGNLALLAQGQGLNLLLNTFFGPVVNAARGIAYAVQGMVFRFCDDFQVAVRPQITKSYAAGDEKGMWRLVEWSTSVAYYLLWVIALPAALEADSVLKVWLGNYPAHTLTFLRLVLALCLVDVLQRPIVYVLHACGRIFVYNLCTGVIMCLAFPLAWIFLRHGLPPESVFVASLIVVVVGVAAEMVILRRCVRYSIGWYLGKIVARCALVTVLSGGLLLLVYDKVPLHGLWRTACTSALSVLLVGGLAFALGFDREMRSQAVGLVRAKIARWL